MTGLLPFLFAVLVAAILSCFRVLARGELWKAGIFLLPILLSIGGLKSNGVGVVNVLPTSVLDSSQEAYEWVAGSSVGRAFLGTTPSQENVQNAGNQKGHFMADW